MKKVRQAAALLVSGALTVSMAFAACPVAVEYALGYNGVSQDLTAEAVTPGKTPDAVPAVQALKGYQFLGWSLSDPGKLKEGETPKLVDPADTKVDRATTFYAVYALEEHTLADHQHYVIGYPNGTFGPADAITRGSVATIIARACLEDFEEDKDYGNPGEYSDVDGHWAQSAIAYCTMNQVFQGLGDGTFQPDRAITRQEFAVVIARLAGVQANEGMPFSDAEDIASWAVDGVYTAYAEGWVNGYTDGTFQPANDIRRDEAVKIFNGYLGRGVDAEGLADLTAVRGMTEEQTDQYRIWPDVPATHWAYYEIVEASNDHTFYYPDEEAKTLPEHWTAAYIDQVWQSHSAE